MRSSQKHDTKLGRKPVVSVAQRIALSGFLSFSLVTTEFGGGRRGRRDEDDCEPDIGSDILRHMVSSRSSIASSGEALAAADNEAGSAAGALQPIQ